MDAFLESINMQIVTDAAIVALRILIPLMGIIVVFQCYSSMRRQRRDEKPLVMLVNKKTDECLPVLAWENSIGRGRSCDITVSDDMSVSRDHCVLLRREAGWFVSDTGAKFGTYVNGEKIEGRTPVYIDDEITVGKTTLVLKRAQDYTDISRSWFFKKPGSKASITPFNLMVLITVFMLFAAVSACVTMDKTDLMPLVYFGIFMTLSWIFYLVSTKLLNRKGFELESLAIFLSGVGVMLSARQEMRQTFVQIIACGIGMILFCIIIKFIQNPDRVEKWRIPVMIIAVLFLASSIVLGRVIYGAANWISIGGISIQPSEFVKVAFIFVGASALDQLQRKGNLIPVSYTHLTLPTKA